MKFKIYDYYKAPGVRELCHDIKQFDDMERRKAAIEKMAAFFIEQDILNAKSVIVPAPQHTGKAEYTRDVAEIVCRETGAYLFDVLYCNPHEPIYEIKKNGKTSGIEMMIRDVLNAEDIMNLDFEGRSQEFFFLDNVIGTGNTYLKTLKVFSEEYGCYFNTLIPLAFALDPKRVSNILSNSLHLIRRYGSDEETISIDTGGSFNYWSLRDSNHCNVR